MKDKPLTPSMQELLDAMKAGTICHFMPYAGSFQPNAYYFRNDTMKKCTRAARGLLERGLVVAISKSHYDRRHILKAKEVSK